ncbi:MAG: hypothetical protein IT191_02880 [Microbacteriaceae bacterium]|nr:hypothetical protein [Cryobacterium sp.]MBX3103470.1 hypothetical protein [Cryobacterium sp.]MCC6375941.1 hypothetical protein [Microbacteriaceae bacterium]
MAEKKETKSGGFSAEEKAAIKQYAAEKRASAKPETGAAKRKRESEACSEAIAALSGTDKKIAQALDSIVAEVAPNLDRKTWYGFPSYAKAGKVVIFFQPASKFKTRYGSIGFTEDANLDDGVIWAASFAILDVNAAVVDKLRKLVAKAIS